MNVSAMIGRLRGKTYTVTRAGADGSYSNVDGSYVPGATIQLFVTGSVQPLSPDDIVSIPEGDRTRERLRFYSAPALNLNDTAKLRKSDVVSVDGVDFQVERVEHWPTHGKAILARVNTNGN